VLKIRNYEFDPNTDHMKKIGIFYGSTLGYTKKIAEKIRNAFGTKVAELNSIDNFSEDYLEQYDYFIFGTSTWGLGEMQEDWENIAGKMDAMDFSSKKIALFGVGDQKSWADSFVNGMGMLHYRLPANENIVGFTSIEGYNFDISLAVKKGQFVGLAIDEVNQAELTDKRVKDWVEGLKKIFV